jgi:hypothetical protein
MRSARLFVLSVLLLTLGGAGSASSAVIPKPPPQPQEIPNAELPFSDDSPTEFENEIGELKAKVMARWPETYSGFWILDGDPSRGIHIGFTNDSYENVERLKDDFSRPDLLRPVEQEYSEKELHELLLRAGEIKDRVVAGETKVPGVDRFGFEVRVDEIGNRVDLVVPNPTNETSIYFADRFPKFFGDRIRVVEAPIKLPVACINRSNCIPGLRGGLDNWMYNTGDGVLETCSSAFSVTVPGADVPRQLLSAGHCGQNYWQGAADIGHGRWHGPTMGATHRYGWVRGEVMVGVLDVERHSVGNGYHTQPYLYRDNNHKHQRVLSVAGLNEIYVGQTVCKSGANTGFQCGPVESVDISMAYVPNSSYFVGARMCSWPGDSGSAIFYGNRAMGVLSSGSYQGECRAGTGFSQIAFVQYFMGLTVDLAPIP